MSDALVTGAEGFLGRRFVRELQDRGWDVYKMCGEEGDTNNDVRSLWNADIDEQYDLVVHCAAVGPNRVAMSTPSADMLRNVHLDAEVIDWAAHTGQRHVLYISSSAVYPCAVQNLPNAPRLSENLVTRRRLDPDGPYGWAKVVGEVGALHAHEYVGLDVTVVRPFSGYGEDQDPDYFPFPAIVRRVLEGDYTVWGPPGQTRDWIHVDDVVRGALAAVEARVTGPVNLCTGRGVEFGDLARLVEAAIHGDGAPRTVNYDRSMPTGVLYRVGDPTKMLEFYEPKITLEEGIRRGVARISGVA